ncbi:MAG TPA: 2-oxoglutarate dehydrogenase E1 component, partial [Azospirillaceae bacterium]|nr:2-oxoglutarate dehydrogenase E1 component [Azospirillaceae bacterium]
QKQLERVFTEVRKVDEPADDYVTVPDYPTKPAEPQGGAVTAISPELLKSIAAAYINTPEGFTVHPKVAPQLQRRSAAITAGPIDWATGEIIALGSLLAQGRPVRMAGQDTRRGTFVQRFATIIDRRTGEEWTPLAHVSEDQASFFIYDSLLSEYAAMGFEYGYSVARPDALVLWEAQFGDFVNGAQIMIDQFISSGEAKWLRMSGLVMLLPHGYEGQGPEHSSARLERFLQLSAEDNWQVANCTTPANYFHILRRQVRRNFRKPLVMMTPKSLLRHKQCVSPLEDFLPGSAFHRVLWDRTATVKPEKVKRVVLCSGKVYYDLAQTAEERQVKDVAIVRVEQLYPFPAKALAEELRKYPNADVVWCQEEPANMGSWFFVDRRIEQVLTEIGHKAGRPKYAGRPEAASPATGLLKQHNLEQAALIDAALSVK